MTRKWADPRGGAETKVMQPDARMLWTVTPKSDGVPAANRGETEQPQFVDVTAEMYQPGDSSEPPATRVNTTCRQQRTQNENWEQPRPSYPPLASYALA